MKVKLTRIGNSRGIHIPKSAIVQCGFGDLVELRVVPEGLMIAPHRAPRHGWRESFVSAKPEPELLLENGRNTSDRKEWKWCAIRATKCAQ